MRFVLVLLFVGITKRSNRSRVITIDSRLKTALLSNESRSRRSISFAPGYSAPKPACRMGPFTFSDLYLAFVRLFLSPYSSNITFFQCCLWKSYSDIKSSQKAAPELKRAIMKNYMTCVIKR